MRTTFEIIETPERFSSLRQPWRALWARTESCAFQSHEWLEAWSRSAAPSGARLRIAVAWHDDVLIAAVPLAVRRRMLVRSLEWFSQEFSDYCDALVAPETDLQTFATLWAIVLQEGGFDVICL